MGSLGQSFSHTLTEKGERVGSGALLGMRQKGDPGVEARLGTIARHFCKQTKPKRKYPRLVRVCLSVCVHVWWCLCVCMCVCLSVCPMLVPQHCRYGDQRTACRSWLFILTALGSRDSTQVVSLGRRHLYLLSHLAGSSSFFSFLALIFKKNKQTFLLPFDVFLLRACMCTCVGIRRHLVGIGSMWL